MHQHGEETHDLRRRRPPQDDFDPLETRVRRFGRRSLTAGLIIAPGTYVLCLVAAVLSGNRMWTDTDGQLFSVLGLITLFTAAAALILIGSIERLQRPSRAREQQDSLDIDRNRVLIERGAVDNQERFAVIMGLLAPLPGRLDAAERGLNALVGVLPEQAQRQYWEGFNDAVREGFQATGTDNPGKRRPRLGLVNPDQDGED